MDTQLRPRGESRGGEREREMQPAMGDYTSYSPSFSYSYHYRYGGWKSFSEDEDRPEKPRRYGVTEMRCPTSDIFRFLPSSVSPHPRSLLLIQDILEPLGQFVDGLKFADGPRRLMPESLVREITELAHSHHIYVTAADCSEHLHRKGPSSFKQYVEECKDLGFDTIELNAGSLKVPEEALLRFVRLIKGCGLKAKPVFALKVEKSALPPPGNRAFGAYIAPVQQSPEIVEDVDLLIRRAERCLEAGADMIMIDAEDVCKYADSVRADIVAKIVGRLGLEKTMFEASNARTSEWFVKQYGPRVNLFVDHAEVMNLECLRGRSLGKNHTSVLGSSFFLM